jgi:trk system potassium uptake protein TrkA
MQAIIVGADSSTCSLAERLLDQHHEVSLVVSDPHRAEEIALRFPEALVVCGPGTDRQSLAHARAMDADAIFALADSDSSNIVTCLLAERLFNIPTRMALSSCADDVVAFEALGIDCLCGPRIIADAMIDKASAGLRAPLETGSARR